MLQKGRRKNTDKRREEKKCNAICILIIAGEVMHTATPKQEKYNTDLMSQLNSTKQKMMEDVKKQRLEVKNK